MSRKNTPEEAAAAKARAAERAATPGYRVVAAARRATVGYRTARAAYDAVYHADRYVSPEAKAAKAAYDAIYNARPEVKVAKAAKQMAFLATPEGKAANAAHKATHRATPLGNLVSRLRARTSLAFRRQGFKKGTKTEEMLGCEWAVLKSHIEAQFTEGMSWDNRGQWHLDHRTPLVSAKDEAALIHLCHYTNLQPLWKKDNLSKGAKMPLAA